MLLTLITILSILLSCHAYQHIISPLAATTTTSETRNAKTISKKNVFSSLKPLVSKVPTNTFKMSRNDVSAPLDSRTEPPRLIYAILWIGLVIYAFGIAPGGSAEAASVDSELIR